MKSKERSFTFEWSLASATQKGVVIVISCCSVISYHENIDQSVEVQISC